MKEQEQWNDSLRKSPFLEPRFTETLKQDIIRKTKQKRKTKVRLSSIGTVFAIIAVCVCTLFASDLAKIIPRGTEDQHRTDEVRTEYSSDGKVLFEVFPDPDLVAGVQRGFLIHFTQSFDTFSGKSLAIEAYHSESGKQITVLAPETITEPSAGYKSMERFVMKFSLPYGGIWRFEVELNERFYGDFVLDVREPSPWRETGTFEIPYVSGDGVSSKYVLAGEEGKVGFIVGPFQNEEGELLDKAPIVAGKRNKYMWYLWGSKEELTGKLSIMAIKEGSNREIDIYRGGSINTADARIPSSMEFPEEGMWRINAYIDNKLFGSIYVNVQS